MFNQNLAGQGGLMGGLKVFARGLVDFRFRQYLSMQLLPFFYALLLLGVIGLFILINVLAFWYSSLVGYVVLALTPLAMAIAFAVVRATLEFLVMAYRIMETLHRMDRIPEQVDNLNSKVDGISEHVNGFEGSINEIKDMVQDVTHTVGFLKPVSNLGDLAGRVLKRRS